MNRLAKKLMLALGILIVIGFAAYRYALTIGSRDLESETAAYELNTKNWKMEFTSNTDAATKKYINKAVVVTGVVASIDKNILTLQDGVSCQFITSRDFKIGEKIKIKGRVTGYDDLLEEIKMDQCLVPINN